jgi:hypothetical protein
MEFDSTVKKKILSSVEGVVGGAWRADDEKAFRQPQEGGAAQTF